jgi:hypothetical protein
LGFRDFQRILIVSQKVQKFVIASVAKQSHWL